MMRQDERRARTRRLLLDAARRGFAERGYEGASLDAIAAAASLSKGAVYAHFPTKQDLYLAVVEEILADARSRVSAVAAALEAGERPDTAAGQYFGPDQGELHAALMLDAWNTAGREPTVRAMLDEFLRWRTGTLAAAAATTAPPGEALRIADLTGRLIDANLMRVRHEAAGERTGEAAAT